MGQKDNTLKNNNGYRSYDHHNLSSLISGIGCVAQNMHGYKLD